MRLKSFDLIAHFYLTVCVSTDRWTDKVIPVYHPNFVAGGIIKIDTGNVGSIYAYPLDRNRWVFII